MENIGPNGFELRETTRPTDTYSASRQLESFYAQAELNLSERIQLLAGVRQEDGVEMHSSDLSYGVGGHHVYRRR